MTGPSPTTSEQIVATCQENAQAITQSLNASLGSKYQLSLGSPMAGGTSLVENAYDEPGVMVLFQVGEWAIACLIAERLPLPNWYRTPDESQESRLQTLAMEWSVGMVPPELEATQFATVACGSLKRQLMACGLDESAQLLEITVQKPMASADPPKILMYWPLMTPRFQAVGDWPAIPVVEEVDEEPEEVEGAEEVEFEEESQPVVSSADSRRRRVLAIPVPLVVRIAEKRIDLRQLRQLAPGMLLTFDKPCEDPLDVYVGGQLYCRGEAVKMGEHFAIKINETESRKQREQRVHRI